MRNTRKAQQGFTLIELMITVVIVAILAAIAYPSYTSYITHSRRSEALAALSDTAARLERYYAQNGTYATATLALLNVGSGLTFNTPTNYYQVGITGQTATSYTITATPQLTQWTNDPSCHTIQITDAGIPPASAACWK